MDRNRYPITRVPPSDPHREDPKMTDATPARRQIKVDADVYDVLERTATSRDTDINGALRYLLEAPTRPVASSDDDED